MTELKKLDAQVFGNLTVFYRQGKKKRYAAWLCRCTCGEDVVVSGYDLRRGLRKSCAVNGHKWVAPKPPGLSVLHPSEYQSFKSMKQRCYDKNHAKYYQYGARGITICSEWRESFAAFFKDMGPKPDPAHTIDRVNNDGNYEPSNCRWATRSEQYRNTRRSVYVEHEGQRMLLMDVANKMGISRPILYGRLKNGWSMEEALTLPVAKHAKKKRKKKHLVSHSSL